MSNVSSSSQSKNKQHHIQASEGQVGKYVLLPGDPGRCQSIAAHFENPRLVASNREFTTFTGTLLGEDVSVTSTGIGGPSTAIAVEELSRIGAHTFIRVGTSGGMQSSCHPGDLVIALGAVRDEGTALQYMPLSYPAVADWQVTSALANAATALGVPHHIGLCHSKDSFYGEVEPERMPIAKELNDQWEAWVQGGVLCSEMEAATLFVVSRILRVRAGAVLLVAGTVARGENRTEEWTPMSTDQLVETATQAVRLLIAADRAKES